MYCHESNCKQMRVYIHYYIDHVIYRQWCFRNDLHHCIHCMYVCQSVLIIILLLWNKVSSSNGTGITESKILGTTLLSDFHEIHSITLNHCNDNNYESLQHAAKAIISPMHFSLPYIRLIQLQARPIFKLNLIKIKAYYNDTFANDPSDFNNIIIQQFCWSWWSNSTAKLDFKWSERIHQVRYSGCCVKLWQLQQYAQILHT